MSADPEDHVRVSVQLIDAQTDRHIWVQNYDRTLADSLALQGELATEIAAACGRDAESAGEGARDSQAYEQCCCPRCAYLHGRVFASEENDLGEGAQLVS